MRVIVADDPRAAEIVAAIESGEVDRLRSMLEADPSLAQTQVRARGCDDTRSLLHLVADWPGHRINVLHPSAHVGRDRRPQDISHDDAAAESAREPRMSAISAAPIGEPTGRARAEEPWH